MKFIHDYFAQVPSADLATLLPQLGFGGVLLYVITSWLKEVKAYLLVMEKAASDRAETINHTIRGLSKALYMQLATGPHSDQFIKDEARRSLDKINLREQLEEDLRRARDGGMRAP